MDLLNTAILEAELVNVPMVKENGTTEDGGYESTVHIPAFAKQFGELK